jgi:hypothetical protein
MIADFPTNYEDLSGKTNGKAPVGDFLNQQGIKRRLWS